MLLILSFKKLRVNKIVKTFSIFGFSCCKCSLPRECKVWEEIHLPKTYAEQANISSARSPNSHPDLLLTHPTHFLRSHWSSTLDFHFLSHYSYIKAVMLYKGNHWTWCAGFMVASWVRLGITNDDLGTSWALPGDNLGMTWALLWQNLARL